MPELRWALLILGVLFLVGLGWWEARRPRQARNPHGAAVRADNAAGARTAPVGAAEPAVGAEPEAAAPRSRGRREPTFEDVPYTAEPLPADALDAPTLSDPRLLDLPQEDPAAPLLEPDDEALAEALPEVPVHARTDPLPMPESPWPAESTRRIVELRLVPVADGRFGGRALHQALVEGGFAHGQFGIFHYRGQHRAVVVSAASLTRPGSFDPETMDGQHFLGLKLFTVLPGPLAPPRAVDELAAVARILASRLNGNLQDELGRSLTSARLQEIKADAAEPSAAGDA